MLEAPDGFDPFAPLKPRPFAIARRGWLTPKDVLNTRGADEFAAAVKPRGRSKARAA